MTRSVPSKKHDFEFPGSLIGSFENEALENEDRSTKHPRSITKHPKLENEAPKISKTKHSKLENEDP